MTQYFGINKLTEKEYNTEILNQEPEKNKKNQLESLDISIEMMKFNRNNRCGSPIPTINSSTFIHKEKQVIS